MSNVELIPGSNGKFYVENDKQYIDESKYVALSDIAATSAMKKGAIIRADMGVVSDYYGKLRLVNKLKHCAIELTEEQFTLVAMGMCRLHAHIIRVGVSVYYDDNTLYINNDNRCRDGIDGIKLDSNDVEKAVRVMALHRIIESAAGICKRKIYFVYNNGIESTIMLSSVSKVNNRNKRLYGTTRIGRKQFEKIDDTIARWNNELAHGRLVVHSQGEFEGYIQLNADAVMKATRRAEALAMEV